MTSTSISAILEKTLDLIAEPDADGEHELANYKSASRQLLEERRKKQEVLAQNADFVPLTYVKPREGNPLFDQISSTDVEKPTYWKSTSKDKGDSSLLTTNKKKRLMEKGEQYKEKSLEKLASKSHRKSRIERMKKMY